jgi:PAS domain S-box-containing protein
LSINTAENPESTSLAASDPPAEPTERPTIWSRIRASFRAESHEELIAAATEEATSRYRDLFDGVPIAIYLSAPDGTIIDVNPAMVELLGYSDRESLLRANAYDLFVDRDVRAGELARLEQQVLVHSYELQLRRRDGELIWVLDSARAVKDAAGRVKFYEGSLLDITERKRAREQLRETNEKLRAIIEASPLAIVSHDLDGIVLSWNKAAEKIFGWKETEVVGRPLPFIPDEEWSVFRRLMSRVAGGEQLEAPEIRRQRRDGSVVFANISAGPLRDIDGNVVGILGVIADITDRKQAQETRRRLAEILEATPDLVGVATVEGRGIYLNPAGREMLKITDEPSESSPPIWTHHPERDGLVVRDEALPSAVRHGTWSGEVVFETQDGREVPTSMVMIAHRTPDGEVDYVSVVARDLTEQKALEERLRQSQTMDAIGRLAGGIAHDFNNLLTTIIGHSDLLLKYLEDEQSRADIEAIKEAGQRAASLTSQLLAFGRRQVLQLRFLDLNAVIASLGSRLKEMVGDRIELVTILDGTLGNVKADPIQLEEVISALVENSCEAMPNGGRLTIETTQVDLSHDAAQQLDLSEPGLFAVLSVIDTGRGIDEETRSRIFEPFFTTKKEVKGTGLGLPTVYGIVKQSGGDVWVDSEPGRGTTIKIYLPAIERTAEPVVKPKPPAERVSTDSATILLVEDEPAVLNLAARVLRARGYTVLEARDGVEALRLQDEHSGKIDMLITDVVMPRVGGPELAERLLKTRSDAGVIYMSGYTDNKTVRDMMADSSVAFLQKPFTPSALAEITRQVLESLAAEE